jgi:hypothetical protein
LFGDDEAVGRLVLGTEALEADAEHRFGEGGEWPLSEGFQKTDVERRRAAGESQAFPGRVSGKFIPIRQGEV